MASDNTQSKIDRISRLLKKETNGLSLSDFVYMYVPVESQTDDLNKPLSTFDEVAVKVRRALEELPAAKMGDKRRIVDLLCDLQKTANDKSQTISGWIQGLEGQLPSPQGATPPSAVVPPAPSVPKIPAVPKVPVSLPPMPNRGKAIQLPNEPKVPSRIPTSQPAPQVQPTMNTLPPPVLPQPVAPSLPIVKPLSKPTAKRDKEPRDYIIPKPEQIKFVGSYCLLSIVGHFLGCSIISFQFLIFLSAFGYMGILSLAQGLSLRKYYPLFPLWAVISTFTFAVVHTLMVTNHIPFFLLFRAYLR